MGLWNDVQNAVDNGVNTLVNVVDNGAGKAQDGAADAGGKAKDTFDNVVGSIAGVAGRVKNAFDHLVGGIVGRPVGFMDRSLRSGELRLLRSVFKNTLPYRRIWISNQLGARPGSFYTVPHPLRPHQWLINLGPQLFAGDASLISPAGLIHEATHVWQGHFGGFGYMANSVWSQGCALAVTGNIDNAYGPLNPATGQPSPVVGRPWASYNVEEQAQLVEIWFEDTLGAIPPMAEDSDPRFPYIRDVIRQGRFSFSGKWNYQAPTYFGPIRRPHGHASVTVSVDF
jgi:hypothetical protein